MDQEKKFEFRINCKDFFGLYEIKAKTKEEAEKLCYQKVFKNHSEQNNNKQCSEKCKLKIKIK